MRLPRGAMSATFCCASIQGDSFDVGSILMPSISNVGGPQAVGTSLISDCVNRATGSNAAPLQ